MNKIVLTGNGSYENRGCEAMVRGTIKILRAQFGDDITIPAGIYADDGVIDKQRRFETDSAIDTFALKVKKARGSRDWFTHQINRVLKTSLAGVHSPLQCKVSDALVALEIGGDNYSLDYGVPGHFLAMDKFLQSRKLPVVIWGASLGPFDSNPKFEIEIKNHLNSLSGVFVRESFSREYLARIGVESNVRQVADSAFLLEPVEPDYRVSRLVDNHPIGLNLSPLIAKKFHTSKKMPWEITQTDLEPFVGFCVEFVNSMLKKYDSDILLVPHVTSSVVGADDEYLLNQVIERVAEKNGRLNMVPGTLNAAEYKWVIGNCRAFIGARTHATIAAIGSGVPTLSLSYSMKARGINQDVFGTQEFCLPSSSIELKTLLDAVQNMMENELSLRQHLTSKLPTIRDAAMSAGPNLAELLKDA